jgi:osmotically-inducible protein OsmY
MGRLGVAVWAWRHRQEIAGWAGYAAKAVPKLVGGEHPDVLTEGRLRMRLSSDPLTRDVDGLRVSVTDGVATLSGLVHRDVHDAVLATATNTAGIVRVRDELEDRPRSFLRR